jgi:hypothetical protein
MRRGILALLLLFGMAGLASANYLLIKVNLEKKAKPKEGEAEGHPLAATAVVELKSGPFLINKGIFAGIQECHHKWGRLMLFGDGKTIFWGVSKQSLAKTEFDIKQKELLKDNSPEKRLELAEWALNRGLIPNFIGLMESLAKQEPPPASVKAAVTAYRQVQGELKNKEGDDPGPRFLPDDPEAIKFWKAQFGTLKGPLITPHYSILYDASQNNPAEVKHLGTRLESLYQGFYYWFAIKGQALPMPKKRLTVVLIDKVEDFKALHKQYDSVPLVADGFYARRENLPILSSVREDEEFQLLRKQNQQDLWSQGWNMEGLVEGKGLPINKKNAGKEEYCRAMTLAVLQKAMQEAGDVHTCTHVSARQLVAISGLIPRNVAAPEWIQFGMASLFETPKGALWSGYGGPHWDYLVEFKQWENSGSVDKPEVALERVITDYYFHRSTNPRESAEQRHLWRELAHMMSWSLTYFLAQRHKQELMNYFQELSSLPRDLEFDQEVLLGCFARAMNIADPTKPRGFNVEKMNALAKEWQTFIKNTAPPIPEPKLKEVHSVLKIGTERRFIDPKKAP